MSRVMVFLTWYLRHGSKERDRSSPPARSSPHEFCRPNAARDVSRPVGTRGGVGWMRGPCAQYISLKDLPREAQRREDQASRQNRETDPQAQRAPVEAPDAFWVCICCRSA